MHIFIWSGSPKYVDHFEGLGVDIRIVPNGILRKGLERGDVDLSGSFRDRMKFLSNFM